MKKCSTCQEEKSLDLFHRAINGKHGRHNICKECRKETSKELWENRESGLTTLYYLPEEHYVGLTTDMSQRMPRHRRDGKITEGYEVIAKFERALDAAVLEARFHQRRYNGSQFTERSWS